MEYPGALSTQGEDEMLEMNTMLMSLVFRTDAQSHQAEASEPPLLVPLVLQLLQEQQGLRFLLQVLRIPATTTKY